MIFTTLKRINLTIIPLLFLFAGLSNAQETKKITLDESLRIGIENSKVLHSSKMKIISADAQLSQVNANRLPSLTGGFTYTRLSKVDPFEVSTPFGTFVISPSILDNYNAKVTLQQPVFTGFKLESSADIAHYNSLAVKQDYNKDEQDVVYSIKNAYWNLYLAGKAKEAVDENVQQIKAHLEDIQNFFKQGLSTRNDVLKVEVQLSSALVSQLDAKNSVKLAQVNLDNAMGIPLTTSLQVEDSVEIGNENISELDELITKGLKSRPELKAMEYRLDASKSGITLAQADWYPQIFLQGDYNYAQPNQRILPTQNKFIGTWDVSLALSVNLWNWGATKDATTQAETQYEQANDSYKTLKDAVTLDVTQNYFNMVKAKDRVTVTKQAVNQAEENYRVTDDKFKQGIALNSDLLDSEAALMQAKTNYAQSIVEYELAKAQLERSTGGK